MNSMGKFRYISKLLRFCVGFVIGGFMALLFAQYMQLPIRLYDGDVFDYKSSMVLWTLRVGVLSGLFAVFTRIKTINDSD